MIGIVAGLLVACGGVARVLPTAPQGDTFATSWTADRCQRLLDQRDAATWGAALGGALSGAGGLATAFPDDEDWQLGLGISTAVVAAVATSLTVLAKMKSDEFEQYCSVAPVAAPAAPVGEASTADPAPALAAGRPVLAEEPYGDGGADAGP
ncbi:MAG: hypothetical protein WC683_00955 [bacterium]